MRLSAACLQHSWPYRRLDRQARLVDDQRPASGGARLVVHAVALSCGRPIPRLSVRRTSWLSCAATTGTDDQPSWPPWRTPDPERCCFMPSTWLPYWLQKCPFHGKTLEHVRLLTLTQDLSCLITSCGFLSLTTSMATWECSRGYLITGFPSISIRDGGLFVLGQHRYIFATVYGGPPPTWR
jgi:hypothetical protein